jgi:hypothetical protein
VTGASAGAQLGHDPSIGAIEHRERPRNRLRLAARVVQRGTVEHVDLVLRRRARDLGWGDKRRREEADEARPRSVQRSLRLPSLRNRRLLLLAPYVM